MNREEAIEAVAHHVVKACVEEALSFDRVGWADYPDASADDWTAIAERARQLADHQGPLDYRYEAACEHLADLAAERLVV